MDLPGRLRELRASLSQKELATELSVSAASVSAWENRRSLPPLLRLQSYASRFGGRDGSSRHELLTELLELRENERTTTDHQDNTLSEVMDDIRWLLVEIRDRLPPRP